MVALEQHHLQSPRARWRALYWAERFFRHRHDGRAQIWLLATLLVAAFWIAIGYGIYMLS